MSRVKFIFGRVIEDSGVDLVYTLVKNSWFECDKRSLIQLQGSYYCRPDLELLELDCLEPDEILQYLIDRDLRRGASDRAERDQSWAGSDGCQSSRPGRNSLSGQINLINPQNRRLTCSWDEKEKLLKACGLGKFIKTVINGGARAKSGAQAKGSSRAKSGAQANGSSQAKGGSRAKGGSLAKGGFYVKPAPEKGCYYIFHDNTCEARFPCEEKEHPRIRFPENKKGGKRLPDLLAGVPVQSLDRHFLHRQGLLFALSPGFDTLISLNVVRNVEPYSYQTKTVQHVLKHMRGRALLCDEVGLGKTVEAGLIMMEYIMRGLVQKVLILTPSSLMEQWQEEMRSKFNLDFVAGDSREFKKAANGWRQFDRIIASIDTAKRQQNRELVCREEYDLVIVDEAHHLKNRKTQGWQLVNRLKKRYILLLTATPVENDLTELFNLITLLSPGQLDTASSFRRRFISRGDKLKPRNTSELKTLLRDVMVRNRRSETGSILTRRHAEMVEVELTPPEKDLYCEVTALVRNQFHQGGKGALNQFVLKTLQREVGSSSQAVVPTLEKLAANDTYAGLREILLQAARKAAGIQENAKAGALLELLARLNDKVIVFTGFQQTRAYLTGLLQRHGFEVTTFHGGMRRAEKEKAIREFQGPARVLVSTESGGEGRNLQFCNVMVNYDLPWNPMRIEQRIGRIHRVGQKRDVFIYNLSARDTIEAKILELLDAKINMFQLVVGELDMILGNLRQKKDFEDILLDIWAGSRDEPELSQRLEQFGEELVQAREHYQQVKKLDENLLGELLPDE